MTDFETQETTYPADATFDFTIGCMGCANQVRVIFDDSSLFGTVDELARRTGAPYGYDISSRKESSCGACGGSCQLRDTALPPDMRQFKKCPNATKIDEMTDKMEEVTELIIEKGIK